MRAKSSKQRCPALCTFVNCRKIEKKKLKIQEKVVKISGFESAVLFSHCFNFRKNSSYFLGGYPIIPSEKDIPGASHGITSDGFFELEDLPK